MFIEQIRDGEYEVQRGGKGFYEREVRWRVREV